MDLTGWEVLFIQQKCTGHLPQERRSLRCSLGCSLGCRRTLPGGRCSPHCSFSICLPKSLSSELKSPQKFQLQTLVLFLHLTPFVILASIHTLLMLMTPECLPIPWISCQKFKLFQPNCLLSSSKHPTGFQMNKSKNLLPSFNLFLPQSYPGRFSSSSCWGQTIWSQP